MSYPPNGNGNGNGHNGHNGNGNGNGHGDGIFGLVPKQDPVLAQVAPKGRREVIFTKTLSFGARMFYALLSDCSLWTGVKTRTGVVRFANSDLARWIGVCVKTIQNWKTELIDAGRIWTTEKFLKNSYPMTVYNVVAIAGEPGLPFNQETEDGSLPEDMNSNRRRARRPERDPATGQFARGGVAKSVNGSLVENSTQSALIKEPVRKILPSSTARICRPQRQPVAVHSGKDLPLPTESHCRSERQPVAAQSGKDLPLPAANSCRSPRQILADNGESLIENKRLESRGEAPPPVSGDEKAFKKWRESLDERFPSALEKMRARFIEQRKKASTNGRALLDRKMAELNLLIDGPQPEWAEPKLATARALPSPAHAKTSSDPVAAARALADLRSVRDSL